MSSPAVFLDRDGVLNEERGFVTDVADFVVQQGVAAALERLGQRGYRRVVVTNQSGVGRGLISLGSLERIHCALREETGGIDALYFCPHHPDAAHGSFRTACACRKPESGMLIRAALDHDLDLAASWMIGDAPRDIVAGQRVGCRTICVTGPKMPSSDAWPEDSPRPEVFVPDLSAAVDYILGA
ncbi:MAG: HAD family hydrolase [Planctomycetes bacterium]|nr:HAD family hydrolase [Planctomycetota bacterium]